MKYIFVAALKDVLEDDQDANNVITFLGYLLPTLIGIFHEGEYNANLTKTLLSKSNYTVLADNFVQSLQNLKFPRISYVQSLLKYNLTKIKSDDNFYVELNDYLQTYKAKFKKLDIASLREVNKLLAIFNADELSDNNWKNIQELSRSTKDSHLRQYLKSLDSIDYNTSLSSLDTSVKELQNISKKLFKTINPSDEQLKELKEKSPDKYKEYRKYVLQQKKDAKIALEDSWDERGLNVPEDVKIVKKLLKELKIPDPIDPGYVGKVAIGPSPSVLFTYYTKYGKELENVPGSQVRMNPKYTEDDNTFYCIGLPQQNFTNKEYRFYTKDYRKKSLRTKHSKAEKLAHEIDIEKLRAIYRKDFAPLLSNPEKPTIKSIAALVTAILDETAGRIGNTGESEKNGVYGIHNLLSKHVTIRDGKAILSYNGKKNVHQRHIIEEPKIVKALTYLKSIRKPSQYIFSVNGSRPVSSSYINNYLKDLGFPDTAHGFRKYHANRIFNEVINSNLAAIKRNPLKVFDKAVDEVAKKLGHQPSNSIKSYIDNDLIRDYFDRTGATPPKIVKRLFELMKDE